MFASHGPSDVATIYLRYSAAILRYFLKRRRDDEEARELSAETFVRLVAALRERDVAEICDMRAYLYGIARRVDIDHLRLALRRRAICDAETVRRGPPHGGMSTEQAVIDRDELVAVGRALDELPPLTKQVFKLTRLDRLTYRDTAEVLGVSESTVQKHLAKAIAHVMRCRDPL